MLGQRVRGEIESEDVFLVCQFLAVIPVGSFGQRNIFIGIWFAVASSQIAEQGFLTDGSVFMDFDAGRNGAFDGQKQLCPVCSQTVERTGFHERFHRGAV